MIGKWFVRKHFLLDSNNQNSPSSPSTFGNQTFVQLDDSTSSSPHHHQQQINPSLKIETADTSTFISEEAESKRQRIAKLKVQYPKLFEEIYEEDNEEDICPICLELYTRDNPQVLCKCSHGFHFQCSEEWKQRSNECPVCFRKLIYMDESEELPPIEKKSKEKKQNPTIMMKEPLYYSEDRPRRGFFRSVFSK